jgi:hypothetical protein
VEYVSCMVEMRNAHKMLAGKPEGKRPLGRSWRKWETNRTMDLRGTGWKVMNWIHLSQDKDR